MTWSPRPSPKQRRSQASTKLAYLAPLKKNQFYPFSYMKEDRPAFRKRKKNQLSINRLARTSPKIKSCITRPLQEPAKAYTPSVRRVISTGAELERFKASLLQVKDCVWILSMLSFKEDRFSCCTRRSTPFIARAQPELTEAQITHRIRRHTA